MKQVALQPGFARYDGPFEDRLLSKLVTLIRGSADPEFAFVRRLSLPWCAPAKPLSRSRVALVSTAGLHHRADPPFRALELPLGDPSFRVLTQTTPDEELALELAYVDPKYTARDPEVALPRRALAALAELGRVGSPAPRHFSLVGGVIRPLPGLLESAVEIARLLREDGSDTVVLVPNCSICVQTVALVADELEARGFPCVCLTSIPELTRLVGAPRALAVHFPFGAPLGDPGHGELHQAVLAEALALLDTLRAPGEVVSSSLRWRRDPL